MALRSAAKQKAVTDVRGMDTNHDGVVDQGEFTAGGGTKQEFVKHDANEDGVLDADELENRAADDMTRKHDQVAEQLEEMKIKTMYVANKAYAYVHVIDMRCVGQVQHGRRYECEYCGCECT